MEAHLRLKMLGEINRAVGVDSEYISVIACRW